MYHYEIEYKSTLFSFNCESMEEAQKIILEKIGQWVSLDKIKYFTKEIHLNNN